MSRFKIKPKEAKKRPAHVHSWQPNGSVKIDDIAYSPVSAMDHQVRTLTYSVQSCPCGAVKRTLVGAGRWRWLNR